MGKLGVASLFMGLVGLLILAFKRYANVKTDVVAADIALVKAKVLEGKAAIDRAMAKKPDYIAPDQVS
jgi:hypothetical protein